MRFVRFVPDQVAAVTGAAGGIGRAISVALARQGCALALIDRDEAGLAQTRALITTAGRRASLHPADVSQRAQMERLPEAVIHASDRLTGLCPALAARLLTRFQNRLDFV